MLALPLSFSGVVIMVYAMLFYPRLQRLLGVVSCVRLGLAATVLVSPLVPLASLLEGTRAQQLMTMAATGAAFVCDMERYLQRSLYGSPCCVFV